MEPDGRLDVLPSRELGVGEGPLHQMAHPPPDIPGGGGDVAAVQKNPAGVGTQHAQDDAQSRGLPGAVETHDGAALADGE